MTFQLKYRGIPFSCQSSLPTEAVQEVPFRGRKGTLPYISKLTGKAPDDVQFFGLHAAGVAFA